MEVGNWLLILGRGLGRILVMQALPIVLPIPVVVILGRQIDVIEFDNRRCGGRIVTREVAAACAQAR